MSTTAIAIAAGVPPQPSSPTGWVSYNERLNTYILFGRLSINWHEIVMVATALAAAALCSHAFFATKLFYAAGYGALALTAASAAYWLHRHPAMESLTHAVSRHEANNLTQAAKIEELSKLIQDFERANQELRAELEKVKSFITEAHGVMRDQSAQAAEAGDKLKEGAADAIKQLSSLRDHVIYLQTMDSKQQDQIRALSNVIGQLQGYEKLEAEKINALVLLQRQSDASVKELQRVKREMEQLLSLMQQNTAALPEEIRKVLQEFEARFALPVAVQQAAAFTFVAAAQQQAAGMLQEGVAAV